MEYIQEIGLLVHDFWWAQFIIVFFCLAVWALPELGIAAFIFKPHLLYNTEFTAGLLGYRLSLDHILMVIIVIRLLFMYTREQEYDFQFLQDPLIKYSLFLTGLILLHPLLRQGWGAHLLVVRQIQLYVIPVFGILILSKDRKRLSRIIEFGFVMLFVLQLMFLVQVLPFILRGERISRVFSVYGVPIWAARGEMIVLISLGYLLASHRSRFTWRLLCLSACLVGVLFTTLGQSRGIFIATVVASISMLVFSRRLSRSLVVILVACGFLLLVVSVVQPEIVPSMQKAVFDPLYIRLTETQSQPDLLSNRLGFWRNAISSFLRSPIWGVGHDRAVGTYVTADYLRVENPQTHNYYLGALSEQGIIGFSLLLAVLYRWLVLSKHHVLYPSRSCEILRYQLLALGFTVYTLVEANASSQLFYWAAALTLVTYRYSVARCLVGCYGGTGGSSNWRESTVVSSLMSLKS
jgi:O-antigen ligase